MNAAGGPAAGTRARDALLAGLIDYAGLFPPAARAMPVAVAEYAAHRAGPQRAMLGRFVVPAARLDEFAAALPTRAVAWPTSVLGGVADADAIARFAAAHGSRSVVDTIEAKAEDPAAIAALAAAFAARHTVYVELAVRDDPAPLVAALAAHGMRAKIRTGGVTLDAFPSPEAVLRFLVACARHGVPFKATAGLHHPLRGEHPLTYAPDAPRATMFGFLNVFLAAALLRAGAAPDAVAPLLEERDPSAIALTDDAITWRGHHLSRAALAEARATFAGSFGSCSFAEPVQDLTSLRML
ncbi:MAG: hypothetical protein K1X31_07365 [Gemmatimonadaceae bacterium]|nr:hypothetical protein [Gemmatimonadaceae bacterium]